MADISSSDDAHERRAPAEVAPGVYRVATGRGLTAANVYLVRSRAGWVLIDTGWPHNAQLIAAAADSVFGPGARPEAIVLTHIHPDHSGSALELARLWDIPVYVHPDELVLARGGYQREYGNPLDRWVIAAVLRLLPRHLVETSRERASLAGKVAAFDPAVGVPALPDWQAVPTPGHAPGHVAFFRAQDRVLITGDAVLTLNVNSVRDVLTARPRVAGPPYISTWNWPAAQRSVAVIASLSPDVLASGHGRPVHGSGTAASLTTFAQRLNSDRQRAPESCAATGQERVASLPGDDLVPDPTAQTTSAVTIGAPPHEVWQWLVQTGQGRAGFYSDSKFWDRCVDWYYRRLSRGQRAPAAVGYHVAADDRIVDAWQHPRVGDIIADGPPGTAHYVVRQMDPGRSFVLFTDTHLPYLLPARLRENPRLGIHGELSDSFTLIEQEPGTTRLVRRMRVNCGPWPFRLYATPIVLIWGEAITARNLLRGIKRRAEADHGVGHQIDAI
jgi:glyoxylase-like metal-dependent hydrolase (beta-lactamase superfamily II)